MTVPGTDCRRHWDEVAEQRLRAAILSGELKPGEKIVAANASTAPSSRAPEVAWAANPSVALGYVFFGIVCAAYSFLPGAKDSVEVDESDVVAGH